MSRCCSLSLILTLGLTLAGISSIEAGATNGLAQAIALPGIHNAFRATAKIYSGSQPQGDEAFAALAKLGIETIISVDGSRPDVAAARRHGLHYIHLPFGYDGIPTNRVAELAKLAATESAPIYVHCHHGKHRGPAAVAVMCEAAAGWSTNQAVAWLREAGTADDYPGLYRAARQFSLPAATELAAVGQLPEVAKSSSVVDAMVAIDAHYEHLKLAQQAGWSQPPGHPDIVPAHEANLLWEQFHELNRLEDERKRPEHFHAVLHRAEKDAEELRDLLRELAAPPIVGQAFKQVGQNCASCHQQYRNE